MKFKFDNNILLFLLLKNNKTNKEKFQKQIFNELKINELKFVKRQTKIINEKHQNYNIYENEIISIKTTDYGRILEIKYKTILPKITIKKRKTLQC